MLSNILDRSILFSFDRTGFRRHRKRFLDADLRVDLTGEHHVITGTTSGLGKATATALAARGATVTMLCRNLEKAARVEAEIFRETGHEVCTEQVDLSSPGSIEAFLAGYSKGPIDVLVNNAGVLLDGHYEAETGRELALETNLLGPQRLTAGLWKYLTPAARVIYVSSGGMYSAKLDVEALFSPPSPYAGAQVYAMTKRAQVVLARQLHRISGVQSSSMHPGWAATPGVESSLPTFYKITKAILRSSEEGADTTVWLAASKEPDALAPKGRFFFDRQEAKEHLRNATRVDDHIEDELFRRVHEAIGVDPKIYLEAPRSAPSPETHP